MNKALETYGGQFLEIAHRVIQKTIISALGIQGNLNYEETHVKQMIS